MRSAASGVWRCVQLGTKACLTIVAVSPLVLAAWIARHPVPGRCETPHIVCRWVIPPEAFRPGGELHAPPAMLWPPAVDVSGGAVPLASPVARTEIPEPAGLALLGVALAALGCARRWCP